MESQKHLVSEDLPEERFFLPDLEDVKDEQKSRLLVYDDERDNKMTFGFSNPLQQSLKHFLMRKIQSIQEETAVDNFDEGPPQAQKEA